jgi:hypothetical protein
MHSLTTRIVAELDLLYGLYELAVDLAKRLEPGDETQTFRVLEARNKILDKTAASSKEVVGLLKSFREEKLVPANERALVEEKRNLILDLGVKMQAVDNQVIRAMQAKLAGIRKDLAGQTERKNAIKAYITAPMSANLVG